VVTSLIVYYAAGGRHAQHSPLSKQIISRSAPSTYGDVVMSLIRAEWTTVAKTIETATVTARALDDKQDDKQDTKAENKIANYSTEVISFYLFQRNLILKN
jgi:hypothetical protein